MQKKRDLALKMVFGKTPENEPRMQEKIVQTLSDTSNLLIYESSFSVPGKNNLSHLVLVFPLQGPCLSVCLEEMSFTALMAAAKQFSKAVESLHMTGLSTGVIAPCLFLSMNFYRQGCCCSVHTEPICISICSSKNYSIAEIINIVGSLCSQLIRGYTLVDTDIALERITPCGTHHEYREGFPFVGCRERVY